MSPHELMPQTPLQQALQGADAATLLLAHSQRLQQCRMRLRQRLADGLAPADYAQAQQLLAMCEAALRVLATLAAPLAAAPSPATGPAAALPRLLPTP